MSLESCQDDVHESDYDIEYDSFESAQISPEDFSNLGIPDSEINAVVIPALNNIGITLFPELSRFAEDMHLQERAINDQCMPLVYVSVIAQKYKQPIRRQIRTKLLRFFRCCMVLVLLEVILALGALKIGYRPMNEMLKVRGRAVFNMLDGGFSIGMILSNHLDKVPNLVSRLSIHSSDIKNESSNYVNGTVTNSFDKLDMLITNKSELIYSLRSGNHSSVQVLMSETVGHVSVNCSNHPLHNESKIRFLKLLSFDEGRKLRRNLVRKHWRQLRESRLGYICKRGSWGRTNNRLLEMMNGLYIANALGRTLVVSNEIYNFYDITQWQLLYPHLNYRIVTRMSSYLASQCNKGVEYSVPLLQTIEGLKKAKKQLNIVGKSKAVKLTAEGLFYFRAHGKKDLSFRRSFYSNLFPSKKIEERVAKYINNHFGERPYAAIHLRDLEGGCKMRMERANHDGYLCSPNYDAAMHVLRTFLGPLAETIPLFVASDGENKANEATYRHQQKVNTFFYSIPCGEQNSVECSMIDFEIAARANFFIGVHASSASRGIAKLRALRPFRHGIYYPSVLHYREGDTIEDYEKLWYVS